MGVSDETAVLLEAAPFAVAKMARELLAAAGIPCLFHYHDRDFAELGEAHRALNRTEVRVAPRDLERARAVLAEAWGEPGDEPVSDEELTRLAERAGREGNGSAGEG